MRSMAGSRVATYLAAATIVGASAAVCAPDARGDDVLGSPAGSQVTVPSVDASVAAAADAVGAATDLVAGAVAAPAAPPSTPEEEPASEGAAGTDATASPAPAPAPAAAIQPQSSLDQSAQSPETTAQDLDIMSFDGRYRGRYRRAGSGRAICGSVVAGGRRPGVSHERERQRPDRERGRQRAGHAGECRHCGHCPGVALDRALDILRPDVELGHAIVSGDITVRLGHVGRAGRGRHVDVGMGLHLLSRFQRDIGGWFHG